MILKYPCAFDFFGSARAVKTVRILFQGRCHAIAGGQRAHDAGRG